MILSLYNGTMNLGGPLIERILSQRLARGKEEVERIDERRGLSATPRPEGVLIWVHAASVGESVAALALVGRLLESDPGLHVLVTTGTVTSARMMDARLPDRALHQYIPVDRPSWVERFLDHWSPDLAILVESEFWPNLILRSRARGVPLVLVNGRMSERSHARWRWVGQDARRLFSAFDLSLASNLNQAERLRSLGAAPVECVGNLKLAAPALPVDGHALASLRETIGGRPVWLAASTHRGEEAAVLAAHARLRERWDDLLLLIAPRHPDRGAELEELAGASGFTVSRRSAGALPGAGDAVHVADTLGEMGTLFSLAPIVFVAGSLVPVGGHNPVEPAHFDCAVLFGPLMSKNVEIAEEFLARGGAQEVTEETLAERVEGLLADEDRRTRIATSARAIATDHLGVLDAVIDRLGPLLAKLPRA